MNPTSESTEPQAPIVSDATREPSRRIVVIVAERGETGYGVLAEWSFTTLEPVLNEVSSKNETLGEAFVMRLAKHIGRAVA